MSDTFVQTAAERKILVEKADRKAALRAEYNKQISNPFRHASGEGGTVVSNNIDVEHACEKQSSNMFNLCFVFIHILIKDISTPILVRSGSAALPGHACLSFRALQAERTVAAHRIALRHRADCPVHLVDEG